MRVVAEQVAPRVGFEHTPIRPADRLLRRVKPRASRRLRRSLTGRGLTRLAGLPWPGRARPRPQGDSDDQARSGPLTDPEAARVHQEPRPADRHHSQPAAHPTPAPWRTRTSEATQGNVWKAR